MPFVDGNNENGIDDGDNSEEGSELDDKLASSLITFGEETLGFSFWQCDTVEPFDELSIELVLVSLRTRTDPGNLPESFPRWF